LLNWIYNAVIGRMVLAFVAVLGGALIAEAQSGGNATGIEKFFPVVYALLGGLVSGAIQYGAIRQTIRDHDRRISEARDLAGKAHDKLGDHVDAWHR
jgi:hypothetical protein